MVPSGYEVILPGRALALRDRVHVAGHPPADVRFSMTDVVVGRASVLELLAALLPAAQVMRRSDVVPANMGNAQYDRIMAAAMSDSQQVAAYVAERAAGLPVPPVRRRAIVVGFARTTNARTALGIGDSIVRVDGRPVENLTEIASALARARLSDRIRVTGLRDGRPFAASIRPTALGGKPKLGVYVASLARPVRLPVAVRIDIGDVSGSSAGLMFALQIYADLRGLRDPRSVAGTGTLDLAGHVGEIEGTRGKYAAAVRAGATMFLVPLANARDLNGTRGGARVIPVGTFADAVRALGAAGAA